jgi:hypothetical protein
MPSGTGLARCRALAKPLYPQLWLGMICAAFELSHPVEVDSPFDNCPLRKELIRRLTEHTEVVGDLSMGSIDGVKFGWPAGKSGLSRYVPKVDWMAVHLLLALKL